MELAYTRRGQATHKVSERTVRHIHHTAQLTSSSRQLEITDIDTLRWSVSFSMYTSACTSKLLWSPQGLSKYWDNLVGTLGNTVLVSWTCKYATIVLLMKPRTIKLYLTLVLFRPTSSRMSMMYYWLGRLGHWQERPRLP